MQQEEGDSELLGSHRQGATQALTALTTWGMMVMLKKWGLPFHTGICFLSTLDQKSMNEGIRNFVIRYSFQIAQLAKQDTGEGQSLPQRSTLPVARCQGGWSGRD